MYQGFWTPGMEQRKEHLGTWPCPLRPVRRPPVTLLPRSLPALSGGPVPSPVWSFSGLLPGSLHTANLTCTLLNFLSNLWMLRYTFYSFFRLFFFFGVIFYLNVFVKVTFCLPGYLEAESKHIRKKSLLAVFLVQLFKPPSLFMAVLKLHFPSWPYMTLDRRTGFFFFLCCSAIV